MTAQPEPVRVPNPKNVELPAGGSAPMFTREQVVKVYGCSHGEFGRLLIRKVAPLPIRIDGAILWFADEVQKLHPVVDEHLQRWRRR
jgi:hypothetical protein